MIPVHIGGTGMTKFGKSGRALVEMMAEACSGARAGSKREQIDAVYAAVMNAEEFTGESNLASHLIETLGLVGVPALRIETASSSGAAAFHAGFQAVASGYYRNVLVVGGEKMTHLSTSATTRILAEVIDQQERQCGATMPALAAMVTQKYRRQYHLAPTRLQRILCAVAMKNHFNGSLNPCAQFRAPITSEQYVASKLIATPLRLYDCAPITDGAAAVLLTAEPTDLLVSGIGQGTGPVSLRDRDTLTSFSATRIAAQKAYSMAGIGPEDIDCAEVHDAFTSFEIIGSEDLGFFAPGKGGEAAETGRTSIHGDLPINASGGLKARGHPVGASGVAQIVEITRALRGENGLQFKRTPRRALAQSVGGLATNNFVTIVERSENGSTRVEPKPIAAPAPRAQPRSNTSIADEGEIVTYTVLYVTPDGFLPPLALALVRDRKGSLVMAQGEDIAQLKIGQEVYLRQVAGIYYFTVKSQLRMVEEAVKRLFSGRGNGRTKS